MDQSLTLGGVSGLLVAVVGGAAVGLERQWSGHASGPHARFGGIRTFTLLGAIAGLAGWLAAAQLQLIAAALVAGAAAISVVGYLVASSSDIDGTTEVSALVVLAAGVLAGYGHVQVASAVFAATALLLLEKTRLHALVKRIDDAALGASARFAAMACVVLPLLPMGPYGPFDAVRPRELWALVLFFSGLSFAGWIARRLVDARQGLVLSGLLGGVISSTSTTLQFARESRRSPELGLALAGGAVGACTVMLVRVGVACVVLNPPLALALPRYLWPAFAIGVVSLIGLARSNRRGPSGPGSDASPLQLRAALQMTGLFQLALLIVLAVQSLLSLQALVGTAAFVGLTDLDALTLSLARGARESAQVPPAAIALVAGVLSNTLLKLVVAAFVGRGTFRMVTTGVLGVIAAATLASLLIA